MALAAPAGAFIYFASFNGHQRIGRSTLDGSGANYSFVPGARHPCAVAVDPTHLYWTNLSGSTDGFPVPGGSVGRANLDGSGAEQDFISGPYYPCGVAVDAAHVYWANTGLEGIIGEVTGTTIGRANLDGTGVDQTFIRGANGPCGVAVDSAHVYWANRVGDSIGRANLDGSGVEPDFIPGADGPCGVAVDAGHVYWANTAYAPGTMLVFSGTTIGRANLDGTAPDQNFITGVGAGAFGVAVDAGHVYWASFFGSNFPIGRANLDGSAVNPNFMNGGANPAGVAVDSDPPALFAIAATEPDASRGIAILTVDVVGPGKVVLSGKDVKSDTEIADEPVVGKRDGASPQVELKVKPTGDARRHLNEAGKVKVKVTITYTPTRGVPESQHMKVKLKKR